MVATSPLTAESTSRFVTAKGTRIHYNEAGTGPAVVMLHGGGPGANGWSNFNRNIGALSERHRVILLDQPGYGQTDYLGNKEPFAEQSSRTVRDLLDALGIEKCTPVGNSMGGAASLNFAIDFPERTEKLVLMGAAASGQSLFTPQPTEGIKHLMETRRNPTLESMRKLINLMVYDASFLTDELLQQRLEGAIATTRSEPGPPISRELHHELGKVKAKTLIVWGAEDLMAPLDGGLRFMRGIAGSRLHVFSQCGHWAQFEHPDEFNRLVEDFLDH
jgi:pimeloyl-ACP methyl ester carboxylesterase